MECARRIPDVVEFRGVLHEEEFAGQTPHGTAAARCAARRLPLQHTVATVEESGDIARLRRALADDDRIVQLRRAVREAAESKLRNGVIDTNDLLRKITEEATAATARSAREIELVKTIYELKHTINR